MSQVVTIFQNIRETETPFFKDVKYILYRIKEGKSKDLVKKIRAEKDKSERNEFKKDLPAVCFSGQFNKRLDSSIIQHSGLICLDFDGYEKKKDLLEDKENFQKNKFVYSVFVSPSGNGLKVLVRIPPEPDNHLRYFNSLKKEFNSQYFDTTSKNLSRVCYESYDPLVHINETSSVWDKIEEEQYEEKSTFKDIPLLKITDENKIVDILIKWWQLKYPMTEGQRNQNVYVLAMALNDFGINKSTASFICNQYSSSDFTRNEIETTINSAYSNTQNFATKYYEDTETFNDIKLRIKRGDSKKEIRKELMDTELDTETIDAVITKAEEEDTAKFWFKNEKGVIKIVPILFKQFLEENGFYKYCPEGSKNYVFVKVTNNLIDHTSEKEIKDFVLNYLYKLEDLSIYNYFADQTRLFREEFLTLLSTIDIYFIADTKSTSYLYYRNCAVQVTKDEVVAIDYVDLGGYVWKDHVIDRNYKNCDTIECDYRTFINNINAGNPKRTIAMESTIGFLMHGHKNLSYCPAIILNDEKISDDPEGGTGKGVFINALGHMKKLVTIDGKAFTFERSFAYQLVSADTQILCFDDVKKHFDFERLFSVITEGLTLEKKNKDAIKIPFHKSPKIAITTNYTIRGEGNSFKRRKWELELHQHYSKEYTPQDEFGRLFFGDWNDDEWCVFDNYMIQCLQLYLSQGLIEGEHVNIEIKKLEQATTREFIEWCGLIENSEPNIKLVSNVRLYGNELYLDFIDEYPDFRLDRSKILRRSTFYKWLQKYAKYKTGHEAETGRDMIGKWFEMKESNVEPVKSDEEISF